MINKMRPIHPGEILKEEFVVAYSIKVPHLAKYLNISLRTVYNLLDGKKDITPSIALRLSKFFGTSPDFWMNLQLTYTRKMEADELDKIVPFDKSASPFILLIDVNDDESFTATAHLTGNEIRNQFIASGKTKTEAVQNVVKKIRKVLKEDGK
jgi:antitoxin HigA-1